MKLNEQQLQDAGFYRLSDGSWGKGMAATSNTTVPHVTTQKEIGSGGIQDEIEQHLKTLVPHVWYSHSRTDKRTTNRPGTPDFLGCFRSARHFHGQTWAMEVKQPGKKPTTEQLGELKWLELAGAKVAVVHSLDEAKEFLRTI